MNIEQTKNRIIQIINDANLPAEVIDMILGNIALTLRTQTLMQENNALAEQIVELKQEKEGIEPDQQQGDPEEGGD